MRRNSLAAAVIGCLLAMESSWAGEATMARKAGEQPGPGKVCPRCGKRGQSEWRVCPIDGEELVDPRELPRALFAVELPLTRVPHHNGGVVTWAGRVYVWSGYSTEGTHHRDRTTALEIYDPLTGRWAKGADIPAPVSGPGEFALKSGIYSVGGETNPSGRFLGSVFRYDPRADRWEKRQSFPQTAWDPMSVVCAHTAYVFGGRRGYGRTWSEVYAYDERKDRWVARAPMPISVMQGAAASYGGRIYVIGGYHKKSEAHTEHVAKVQVYDPAADRWQVTDTALVVSSAQAVAVPGALYVFASRHWDPRAAKWVDEPTAHRYHATTGQWEPLSFRPPAKAYYSSAIPIVDGRGYLLDLYREGKRSNEAYTLRLLE
ncbi:Kelch repeat-containing protein [Planctomycetota bacterium]